MGFPKKIRLHVADADKPRVETFAHFCAANGGLTRDEGAALLNKWVRDGALRRRDDGGYDVLKHRPRLTSESVKALRTEIASVSHQ